LEEERKRGSAIASSKKRRSNLMDMGAGGKTKTTKGTALKEKKRQVRLTRPQSRKMSEDESEGKKEGETWSCQ